MCGGVRSIARALGRRRVAGPHRGGDARRVDAELVRELLDAAARLRQVLVDVGAQRLERRDVDDRGPRRAAARAALPGTARRARTRNAASVLPEPVGAAISVWRPAWIARPAARCAARRLAERLGKPACDDGMEGHGAAAGERMSLPRTPQRRASPQPGAWMTCYIREMDPRGPLLTLAIEPKTMSDQEKLGAGLQKLMAEDPTVHVAVDPRSGRVIIGGVGELRRDHR